MEPKAGRFYQVSRRSRWHQIAHWEPSVGAAEAECGTWCWQNRDGVWEPKSMVFAEAIPEGGRACKLCARAKTQRETR